MSDAVLYLRLHEGVSTLACSTHVRGWLLDSGSGLALHGNTQTWMHQTSPSSTPSLAQKLYCNAYRSSGPPSTSGRGPFDYTGAPYPPVVMSTLQGPGQPWDQQPWQMCVSKFTGTEPRNSMIPKWLCDAVLARRIPSVKETKAGFLLMPAQVLPILVPGCSSAASCLDS